MNRKNLIKSAGITLFLAFLFDLLPACGSGSPSASPSPTGIYHWRYQSSDQAGSPTYWAEQEFVASIAKASGGRLILDLAPMGAIVGNMEIFDAITQGMIECGSARDSFWQGKDRRFMLSGVIPAHFTWQQAATYYYCDSTAGREVTNSVFEQFGVKRFVRNISEPDVAVANIRIVEAKDYKAGYRGNGYTDVILQEPEFGAWMSHADDTYAGLKSGELNAFERGDILFNYGLHLQEVTKYWIFPGMQFTKASSFLVNLNLWNSLPEDLKEIITLACSHNLLRSKAFSHLENAKLIPILQKDYGIEMVRLSPDCQQTWKTVSWRLADQYGEKNAEFKAMWDDMKALINILEPYEKLQTVTYPDG